MNTKRKKEDTPKLSSQIKVVWEFFRPLLKSLGWRIWGLFALTFLLSFCGVGFKVASGYMIDLITNQPEGVWGKVIMVTTGLLIVKFIQLVLSKILNFRIGISLGWILRKFKNTICDKVERAMPEVFLNFTVQSIHTRIKEVSDIRNFIRRIPHYLSVAVTGCMAVVFATAIHPAFLLILGADFILSYKRIKKYVPREIVLKNRHKEWNDSVNQAIKDGFDRIEDVHMSGSWDQTQERVEITSRWSQKSHNSESWADTKFGLGMSSQSKFIEYLYNFLGIYLVLTGTLTVGEYVTLMGFWSYIDTLEGDILDLIGWEIPELTNTVERIEEVLDIGERKFGDVKIDPSDVKTLEVRNITYSYKVKDKEGKEVTKTVLSNISMKMKIGETCSLVGDSGSGKSTLARLIGGLRTIQFGEILVNGIRIQDISKESLPGIIGMVSQRNTSVTGTFRDQFITTGNYTPERMVECCRIACIHDFIMSTSDGYDTFIGEKALKLSGGQLQRVLLAVSLMQEAAILILDEATSALDPRTQLQVMKNLKESKFFVGRLIINIAHRLAITTSSDKIFVLGQNGTLQAEGTHKELMESSPDYREMVMAEIGNLAMI